MYLKLSTKLLSNRILFYLYRTFVLLESLIVKSYSIKPGSILIALILRALLRDPFVTFLDYL